MYKYDHIRKRVVNEDYISCELPICPHIESILTWLNNKTNKFDYDFSGTVINQFLLFACISSLNMSVYDELFKFTVFNYGFNEDIDNYQTIKTL